MLLTFSCKKLVHDTQESKKVKEINRLLQNSANLKSNSLERSSYDAIMALDLSKKAHNDTLTCKSWFVLGSILHLQGYNDKAFAIFQNALQLSKKIHYNYGICRGLIETGSILYIKGEYEKSLLLFQEAKSLAEEKKYHDLEASSLKFIGKYYHTTGHFNESVAYYKKAIELYKSTGNMLQSASVLLGLGKTYNNDGNLYMALKCYLDSYSDFEKTNDLINLADVCNHLGTIYIALSNPSRSMEYHRKALAYRELVKTPDGIAKSFNNIGEVFLVNNNPDSARIYFLKSLDYCEQISYLKGKVKALTNLGKSANLKLKPQIAKQYLLVTLDIALKAGYGAGIAEASLEMGNTFLSLNQPDSARKSFELSLEKAKSANLTELDHDAYWGLYRCSFLTKDYEKALEYHTLFSESEKKLLQAQNNNQMAELRVTFETEKKEKDIELLLEENKRKAIIMWMIIIALAFTSVLSILLYSRYQNKRRANQRLEKLNNQIVNQNKELEKLNKELEIANIEKDKVFSIIAHELRNPLFWFQNLTEMLSLKYHSMPIEKVQKSLNALDESAKNAFHLMDNLLHWSRSRLNRITPKIVEQSLQELISQSTRMYSTILDHKNIKLSITIPQQAKIIADPDLFTCIIRNLVSNAIKYTHLNGSIEIICRQDGENYTIAISDSGIGIDHDHLDELFDPESLISRPGLLDEKGSGIGLKLCKEFVEMNGGKIWVDRNNNNGSCFCFTVPSKTNIT